MRRVIRIVPRFRRTNRIVRVRCIGAATQKQCQSHCADQRKDGYDGPAVFSFSHAFGALISREAFYKRKLKIETHRCARRSCGGASMR